MHISAFVDARSIIVHVLCDFSVATIYAIGENYLCSTLTMLWIEVVLFVSFALLTLITNASGYCLFLTA